MGSARRPTPTFRRKDTPTASCVIESLDVRTRRFWDLGRFLVPPRDGVHRSTSQYQVLGRREPLVLLETHCGQ